MGLVDKLTEVDKYVWKQYEKVTQYCNKEYGWDKYDLERKSNKAMVASGVGVGFYNTLEGYLGSSPIHIGVGLTVTAFVGGLYYLIEGSSKRKEAEEIKKLERGNGTVSAPQFLAWRPPYFGTLLILRLRLSDLLIVVSALLSISKDRLAGTCPQSLKR